MQSAQRRHRGGVIGRLEAEPQRFQFFQAVRLLRRHLRRNGEEPVGEAIRFSNSLSLAFAPSEIEALTSMPATQGAEVEVSRVILTQAFMGLTGNQGALPHHYTERLIEREFIHRDRTARAFLDIFTNRAVTQFYAAWVKYRLHFAYEADPDRHYLPVLLAFAGVGNVALRRRLGDANEPDAGIFDETLGYYAGILRNGPRSAKCIEAVLGDFFRIPVRIIQFSGQWFRLPEDHCAKLGLGAATLGRDLICGERIWQRDGRIRIELGPLSRTAFLGFMPGAASARALDRLLGFAIGSTIEVEVCVKLDRRAVPPLQLGVEGAGRLGWDSWVTSRPFAHDPDDATYRFVPGFLREATTSAAYS
jgi:type VI secretion system protein ImpH